MPIPTQLSDLSTTAASNSPAATDSLSAADDNIRALASIIKRVTTGVDAMTAPNLGAATGTSLAVTGTLSMGSAFGFRNKIVNGGFDVWQRGTSFTASSGAVTYCADRWAIWGNGAGTTTITQVTADTNTQNYAMKVLRTAGATSTTVGTAQIIESINAAKLSGKSVTVTIRAKKGTAFTGSANAWLSTATGVDQGASSLFAGSWTGGGNTILTAISLTTTMATYSFTATVPSGTKEIACGIYWTPSGTASGDDSITIESIQLEEGSVATPFESRPYGLELALCQRYYYRTKPSGVSVQFPRGVGIAASTTAASWIVSFPVPMRVAPSSFEQTGTASDYHLLIGNTSITCSANPTFVTTATESSMVNVAVASGLTVNNSFILRDATGNAYLGWSAEL